MKKLLLSLFIILLTLLFSHNYSSAQESSSMVLYTYSRPIWTIGLATALNLATNDAYGRANYASHDQILRDNYGMRWGYGGQVFGKYAPGKHRNDRIYLSFDYKGMKSSDFSDENSTKYDIMTIAAGYEYLTYGTYGFRCYYGGGVTGNIMSGEYIPRTETVTNVARAFKSTFRVGLELKTGLEFVLKNRPRNLAIHVGARYNLMNIFNEDNLPPTPGQTHGLNFNDGDALGGPGFKRYMGIFSVDFGLCIYPDVERKRIR